MVVEIAGARALAPFFGTSLAVWSSQITATLLFLALGYGVWGWLARKVKWWTLAGVFGVAGVWLLLYPMIRTPVLDLTSGAMGVALGSLVSAGILFGLPLMMLGASSPVMVAYLDRRRPGAGSAAGRLFFVNTLGGLGGGWMTAFVLIPFGSLRLSLAGVGVVLIGLACVWALVARGIRTAATLALVGLVVSWMGAFERARWPRKDRAGNLMEVLYSRQSGVGLVQVVEGPTLRWLQIDGVIQGEMLKSTGLNPSYDHDERILAFCYHPQAKRALQLGLGPGLAAKELAQSGMEVWAAELDPRVLEAAREYFSLPDSVKVVVRDAREFLRHTSESFDLIFLDTYAGETTPWHLMTVEAMEGMKGRLRPGGRLIVNFPAYAWKPTPQLAKVESAALKVFGEAIVVYEPGEKGDPESVVNVHIVAGEHLAPTMQALPKGIEAGVLARLQAGARPARGEAEPMTDDRSDLDYLESPFCMKWRRLIWANTPTEVLGD